jgi:hypothetical protein
MVSPPVDSQGQKKTLFRAEEGWITIPFPSIPPAEVLANLNNDGGNGEVHEAMVTRGRQVVKEGGFR